MACFEPESLALYEQRRSEFKARRDYFLPQLNARGTADPARNGRDARWPLLAVGLGDKHSPDRRWSVRLLPERHRQFAEPLLHAVRLDIGKVLTIHTRRPFVGAALGIGMGQDILPIQLVVQRVEAEPGFRLRFRV